VGDGSLLVDYGIWILCLAGIVWRCIGTMFLGVGDYQGQASRKDMATIL
jgi:hypothetical protein